MSNFHVESKRVPKINDPLLVIGLGGTGSDALLHIMQKFKGRFTLPVINGEVQDRPERTAYLAVDSDMEHLNTAGMGDVHFKQGDKLNLNLPDMESLLKNPAAMQSYEKSWWDVKIHPFKAGDGAGGFRQVGRLLLFRNSPMIVEHLVNAINKLMAVDRASTGGNLTVVLTTGIGGGTGSGTFLDIAYLIRYVMKTYFSKVSVNIMAYIIMPGVNLTHMNHPKPAKIQVLKMNAFAALKELDFWMNYEEHKCVHLQTYSTNISYIWDSPPFNNVVLLSEGKSDGTVIMNAYDVVMDVLAESLLNFFAAEQNISLDGAFSYRSHSVNVAAEANAMSKAYPVNYAYMSVGAASSEAQQDNMVVYEAKLSFDEVVKLQKAESLLGTREADSFFGKVLPEEEDLFRLFENTCPLPSCFHGEPGYDPESVLNMQGELALHCQPYRTYDYNTDLSAKQFAKERADLIYKRFQETVREYGTDPTHGPFVVVEMLSDPEKGFTSKFHGIVQWWQTQKENADNQTAQQLGVVTNAMYPDMLRINRLSQALKMYGKVTNYVQSCEQLYISRRDYRLASYMAEEIKRIESKISDYSTVILPTFCDLIKEIHLDLKSDVDSLLTAKDTAKDMINFLGLKAYVDQKMQGLSLAKKMNGTTINILKKIADASLAVSLDAGRNFEDWENLQKEFLASVDTFVNELGEEINGITMDEIFNMTMPNTTDVEKIDYMINTLMPNLRSAAQTMLKLVSNNDGMVEYSYVSVPDDARIVRASLDEYSKSNHITPKYSRINDRIYWLNTFNCLPMYRYADLTDLESNYERALEEDSALGIHLVRSQSEQSTMRNDWSVLPSPIPHVLLGAKLSKRQAQIAQSAKQLLSDAIRSQFAVLSSEPTKELLTIRILLNENGTVMEPEVFEEKVRQIQNDSTLPYRDRLNLLHGLRDNGKPTEIRYRNFTDVFANAMGLKIVPKDGTMTEKLRVDEAIMAARLEVAQYILTVQHPDVVEQMEKQRTMYDCLNQAVTQVQAWIGEGDSKVNFVKPFMHMYLFDLFIWNRQSIDFMDVRGQQTKLLGTNLLTGGESDLYAYCKPLVLMNILSAEDRRIDKNHQSFLATKAKTLMDEIDRMPAEQYEGAQKAAEEFIRKFSNTPNEILYDRGDLSKIEREQGAMLVQAMLKEAKIFNT
jgi:hypothetical protein